VGTKEKKWRKGKPGRGEMSRNCGTDRGRDYGIEGAITEGRRTKAVYICQNPV